MSEQLPAETRDRPGGAMGCFRALLAFVLAAVVLVYGVGAGVHLVREGDMQVKQVAGMFVILWALMLTRFVWRKVRGVRSA